MILHLLDGYHTPYGSQILCNPAMRLAYVCILKNAHTWASRLFIDNLKFELVRPPEKSKYVVILRDPVERWISGISQLMSTYNRDTLYLFDEPLFLDFLFTVARWDEHTSRQVDSLVHLDINNCLFFKCDSSLEHNLIHYVSSVKNSSEIVNNNLYNTYNTSDPNTIKVDVHSKISSLIQRNPAYRKKITNYYRHDLELINYVTSNNLWYSPNTNT